MGATPARLANGTMQCWGSGNNGELGDGTSGPITTTAPVNVLNVTNVARISAGAWHSCAILTSGTAQCWGDNFEGELGIGAVSMSEPRAVTVMNLTGILAMAGGGYHACAIASGGVWCTGTNMQGQLGQPSSVQRAVTPLQVPGFPPAVAVTAGAFHTCAQRLTGPISCWGAGTSAQLGNGGMADSTTPVDVRLSP